MRTKGRRYCEIPSVHGFLFLSLFDVVPFPLLSTFTSSSTFFTVELGWNLGTSMDHGIIVIVRGSDLAQS
jgi:hypothetical protein